MTRKLWLLLFVLLAALACSGNGASINPNQTDPAVGNKDNIAIPGVLSIDETKLRATVDGDKLFIDIPLKKLSGDALRGTAYASVVDLDGAALTSGDADFSLGEDGNARVTLDATELPAAGEEEVLHLVKYGITTGNHELSGVRSLFFSLPKFDLRTRFPSTLYADGTAKVRVFLIDPTRNAPLADMPVKLEMARKLEDGLGEPTTIEAITNEAGTAVFDVPAEAVGDYVMTATSTAQGYIVGQVEDDVSVVRTARVLVTTDKPMYKPGQKMDVRALVLRKPNLQADANQDVTFEIKDGKGNMVFRKYEKTNDFGIAATRFQIASQVNMGNYEVKAIMGATETSKTVPVTYYALPKFGVTTTLDKTFYLAGETLSGVVNARYFFGKAVEGGQVTVKASAFDIGFTNFQTVNGVTNAEGLYDFEITLPTSLVGQDLESGNALVTLEISVTDGAAHTETKTVPVVVAKAPINLVAIPESGELVPGLENTVYLFATDPLGAPVDVAFTVALDGTAPEVGVIGAGIGQFTVLPQGEVAFTVTAADEAGLNVSQDFTFTPGESQGGVLVRTDKSLYRVGETVKVRVYATDQAGRLFLDVIKDGQTAKTEALDLVDGMAGLDLDLDGSLVGDLVIEAYLVTSEASIVRDKKLVFVKDAKGLDITITPDKGSYKPGEPATLDFEVKDSTGAAAQAALGVQIVDEAVYALTEMKPGLLETYFLIEEELQSPKYEIHGASFNFGGIVTSSPDDAESQTVAGAAFAALDQSKMGGAEKSSWTDTLAALPGKLQPRYQEHVKQIQESVQKLMENGFWTYDSLADDLKDQTIFFDYWGNLYTFDIPDYWDAKIHSRGPDEIDGTSDDWSARIEVGYYYSEDGDFANEGGPQAGGGGWDNPGAMQDASAADTAVPDDPNNKSDDEGKPKVRKDFPETLYWNPALLTDEAGKAQVQLEMADSITEWRVTSVGNTAAGLLGSATAGVTVFQDFFVDIDFPATLTRNDQVTFPVAVYNYLPITQTVTIEVEPGDWFTLAGSGTAELEVQPGEVTVVSFPVTVDEVGWHALTVTGLGTAMSDAVQRMVLVKPDGKEIRESKSGMLKGAEPVEVAFPDTLIPNSHELLVKIYPGIMAQAVEGLDSLLQMPSGCFEQTTATNWPNTLVTRYLRVSGQINPEIELKAVDFLQQGYQRLLTYECTGGGFVWFGDPSPANVILSAMGVFEFSDMAAVIEVDKAVIDRTVAWLLTAQAADGHWHTDQGSEFASVQYDDVKTTAYVSWALGESGQAASAVAKANDWLATYAQKGDTDVYALSLIAVAYAASEPDSQRALALFDRLADLASEQDGKVFWTFEGGNGGWGGMEGDFADGDGSGTGTDNPVGNLEVTAHALQAFEKSGAHLDLVGPGIAWLAAGKDSFGNWGTTHGTIQALRAMIGSLGNKTEDGEGLLEVYVNGQLGGTLAISDENRNVFHQFELGSLASTVTPNTVEIQYEGTGNLMYQVVWSWYEPIGAGVLESWDVLDIDVSYDKTHLAVDDVVAATATVKNNSEAQLDMVMVDLGVPPGFTVLTDKLAALVESQQIMKYELPGQQITIYLEKLLPGQTLEIGYDLQAKYPIKAQAGSSSAYLYYDTAKKTETAPVVFEVTE